MQKPLEAGPGGLQGRRIAGTGRVEVIAVAAPVALHQGVGKRRRNFLPHAGLLPRVVTEIAKVNVGAHRVSPAVVGVGTVGGCSDSPGDRVGPGRPFFCCSWPESRTWENAWVKHVLALCRVELHGDQREAERPGGRRVLPITTHSMRVGSYPAAHTEGNEGKAMQGGRNRLRNAPPPSCAAHASS